MKKLIMRSAAGGILVAGGVVLCSQGVAPRASGGAFAAKGGGAGGGGRHGPHFPAEGGGKPRGEVASAAGLLEKLAVWREAGGDFDREGFRAVMAELLELDAEAAARFTESCPAGPVRDEALRRVARGLAGRDPGRAERWALGLADEPERESALGDVCTEVALTDAAEAVRKVERHPFGTPPDALLENIVQQWAAQDFSAAQVWTLARPAGEQREQMCGRLAIVRAATLPEEAARLVLDEIPEGPIRTETLVSLLYQWSVRDMKGAAAWVALFPDSPLKERAENELSQVGRLR